LCHSFGCFLILLVHYEFILGIYPPAWGVPDWTCLLVQWDHFLCKALK
jgi:hypothetical protein